MSHDSNDPKIAVLLPCYNEEMTIAQVVADFRSHLPRADIYVFDNNSKDKTAETARKAGAIVVTSPRQGKGNVVRHMFREVNADYYLMADGDGTYPASAAPALLEAIRQGHSDMIVGMRLQNFGNQSFRRFHQFGNKLITGMIRLLFDLKVRDVLSGYRAFSDDFVKSIPLFSEEFEIETELTLQAVAKGYSIREIPIEYGERPEGSHSKLNTFSDGWMIIRAIFLILKDYKPFLFFGCLASLFFVLGMWSGYAPIVDFIETPNHFVTHVPRAVLAAAFMILSSVSLAVGVILETVHRYHNENFLLQRRMLAR